MILLYSLILGVVSGLRSMLAPAVVSWAVHFGLFSVAATPLAFMGYKYTPIVLTLLALGELIADKLPKTPSRKSPMPFAARVVSGGLVGATIGASNQMLAAGLIAGALGAVVGTLGGAAIRRRLASAFGNDLPAALIEDFCGILIAVFAVLRLR